MARVICILDDASSSIHHSGWDASRQNIFSSTFGDLWENQHGQALIIHMVLSTVNVTTLVGFLGRCTRLTCWWDSCLSTWVLSLLTRTGLCSPPYFWINNQPFVRGRLLLWHRDLLPVFCLVVILAKSIGEPKIKLAYLGVWAVEDGIGHITRRMLRSILIDWVSRSGILKASCRWRPEGPGVGGWAYSVSRCWRLGCVGVASWTDVHIVKMIQNWMCAREMEIVMQEGAVNVAGWHSMCLTAITVRTLWWFWDFLIYFFRWSVWSIFDICRERRSLGAHCFQIWCSVCCSRHNWRCSGTNGFHFVNPCPLLYYCHLSWDRVTRFCIRAI